MMSFEIHLQRMAVAPKSSARGAAMASAQSPEDTLDFVVAGERFSAATCIDHAATLTRDLTIAALSLVEGRATRCLVPCYDTPWELCLCPGEDALLVSVYRTGAAPEVRVFDHPVRVSDLAQQLRSSLARMPTWADEPFFAELKSLIERLERASGDRKLTPPARDPSTAIRWQSRALHRDRQSGRAPLVKMAFQAVVQGATIQGRHETAQADMHALLCRGRLSMELRAQRFDLATGFVFLQTERLVQLCRPLMESLAARRSFHLRANVGAATLGLRLGVDEQLALTIARSGEGTITVPALDPRSWIAPVLEGALALCSALVRCDRTLARNLRLRALRNETRALRRWLRDLDRLDAKVNPDPGMYRSVSALSSTRPETEMDLGAATRLRYTERWRAEIEGLDLAGTLLCGDKLVVPGARELHALDRQTGSSVWSLTVSRAATTLAGENILRLSARGDVELRSVSTGEVIWATRISPRVGSAALAHAITAPGLPRMVVLAEGERRLVALDLRTGEARWTYTSRHGGAFRMRRIGRLLIVVSGDAAVTAIDVTTGEVVWRFSDRIPFTQAPVVHREHVLVMAGDGGRSPAKLYALGAFTGALAWSTETEAPAVCAAHATGDTVATVLATREGATLSGYDLATGAEKFRAALGVMPGSYGARPAMAAFDDLFVTNLPTGRVVASDANTGATRWLQAFRAPIADDVPRRLDPQLRAGALFVPQSTLAVLRPRDGMMLAEVDACDLVPDLVRVDEQCALYVAEESGHMGCFELGARLRVIRPV